MGSQRYILKASKTERQWRTMKNEGSRAAISCYTRPAPPNFSSAPNRSCDCCWATSTLPYHETCIKSFRDFSHLQPISISCFLHHSLEKRNQPTLMHRQSMSQKTQPTQAPPAAPGYAGHPALLGADASTTWTPPQRAWSSTQIRVKKCGRYW